VKGSANHPAQASEHTIECPKCHGTGTVSMSFGMLVQMRRKTLGITQEELAEKVGLTRPQVTNIETGSVSTDIRRLRDFAAALDCQVDDLIP
jgi:DNA-binding XRE family transcriptional regulator